MLGPLGQAAGFGLGQYAREQVNAAFPNQKPIGMFEDFQTPDFVESPWGTQMGRLREDLNTKAAHDAMVAANAAASNRAGRDRGGYSGGGSGGQGGGIGSGFSGGPSSGKAGR